MVSHRNILKHLLTNIVINVSSIKLISSLSTQKLISIWVTSILTFSVIKGQDLTLKLQRQRWGDSKEFAIQLGDLSPIPAILINGLTNLDRIDSKVRSKLWASSVSMALKPKTKQQKKKTKNPKQQQQQKTISTRICLVDMPKFALKSWF